MRDLKTGNKTNERWRTADTVERLMTEDKEYTYSYTDGTNLVLMDPETLRAGDDPGRHPGRGHGVPAGQHDGEREAGRGRPGRHGAAAARDPGRSSRPTRW